MDEVFEYIIKNGGIDAEVGYPYDITCKCRFDPANIGAKISSFRDVVSKDENALQQAVAPISVGIDASHSSFQLYTRGVYNEVRCDKPCWIVKNSWGMNSYIMMTRNQTNQCGIATTAIVIQLFNE